MKPWRSRCACRFPESGSITQLSLHLLHEHLISVLLFRIMSAVAHFKNLATMSSLIMRTIFSCTMYTVQIFLVEIYLPESSFSLDVFCPAEAAKIFLWLLPWC